MNSSISEYNKKSARMRRYEKIMSTVNELLEKYIGGQVFFTELDKAVKFDVDILYDLIDAVHEKWGTENLILIASGEVGLAFHNFGLPVDIIVPGGLRFDPSKINLAPYKQSIVGKDVVFVDDSYFSGRTLTVVHEAVEELGGHMIGAYVAYDGAKERDPSVMSLYRYYDHYDILGRRKDEQ